MKLQTILFLSSAIVFFLCLLSCSPQIEKFGAKKNAKPNEEVKLNWETKNASSVELLGLAKNLPLKGSLGVKSLEDKTYTLIARHKNGRDSVSKEFEIKIIKAPLKIRYLKVSALKTTDEKPILLNWAVDNANKISLKNNDNVEILKTSGSTELKLDSTSLIHFIAENEMGEVIDSVIRIEVERYEFFRTTENKIYKYKPFTLEWKIKDAASVDIEGIGKGLPPTGKKQLQLKDSTTFTLKALKKNGAKYEKKLNVPVYQPELVYFRQKNYLSPEGNEKINLIWDVQGVRKVAILGYNDSLPNTGALNIMPEQRTKYTLSYFNGDQNVEEEIWVEAIKPFWGPKQIYRGQKAKLYWDVPGGKNISIDGVAKDLKNKDSIPVEINDTQIYTLRFERAGKQLSVTHKIRVIRNNFISNIIPFDSLGSSSRLYFDIYEFDRSNYPQEVKMKVIVTDEKGNYVQNLGSSQEMIQKYFVGLIERVEKQSYRVKDFKVKEYKEQVSKPYSFSMVLDYSGSMSGVIEYAEKGAKALIETKQPQDEISITQFDDKLVSPVKQLTDTAEIFSKIKFEGLKGFGGSTALYAGGDEGLKQLEGSQKNKVEILLTDGYENSSLQYFITHAYKASLLVLNARKAGIKIFPIAFGNGVNDELLDDLAKLTDGSAYYITDPKDIERVYKEIPRLYKNYYEITYVPVQKEGLHSLELEYNNHKTGISRTVGETHIGENYNIDQYDDFSGNGIVNLNGLKPVSAPQVLAFFEFDNYKIEDQYMPNIKNFVRYMKMNPQSIIEIYGHTDLVGTEEDCLMLSEKRAEEAKKILIQEGIDEKRIKTKPMGKTSPVWNVEDKPWKASENRRIEIILYE